MWKRIKKGVEIIRKDLELYRRWPKPNVESRKQKKFLFILTLPRSGSTILAKTLRDIEGCAILNEKAEGQWLVRGLCEEDRWNADKEVDWKSVYLTWKKRINFIENLIGEFDVVVEKSPPNMMRIGKIKEVFPNNLIITLSRNPYGYCYSYAKRQNRYEENLVNKEIFKCAAEDWILKSKTLVEKSRKHSRYELRYKDFCEKTGKKIAKIMDKLRIERVEKKKILKDNHEGVENKNERSFDKVKEEEKNEVARVLDRHEDVLDYFGYSKLPKINSE